VGNGDDQHQQLIIVDLIDNPVVAGTIHSDPPSALLADHRPTPCRTWLSLEAVKLDEHPSRDLSV